MIEKLKNIPIDMNGEPSAVWLKINELVDAVNGILDYAPLEMAQKAEPKDPYAEQRKWVGKLCRFWDEDYKDCCVLGILDSVDTNRQNSRSKAIYFDSESAGWWEHCQPVKPDDDIIYKGE